MSTDVNVLDKNPVATPTPCNVVVPQMGSTNKEAPLVAGLPEIKPAGSEAKHGIDNKLAEIGVEEVRDRPDLTPEHQELGIDHAGPHVPVSSSPSGKVTLPMSEGEMADKLKTGQDDDSGRWLAWLVKKIMAWALKAR